MFKFSKAMQEHGLFRYMKGFISLSFWLAQNLSSFFSLNPIFRRIPDKRE